MRNKDIRKLKHKVEDNKIMYLNGDEWAVREFCESKKEAKDKFKKYKDLKHLKE